MPSPSIVLGLSILLCSYFANGQSALKVNLFDQPVIIDGQINAEEWLLSDSLQGFYQLEPEKGLLSTRSTVVMAGQYQKDLYFAFICYIDSPDEIAARIQRRDRLDDSDDVIAILLDTYNDKRTALLFMVNPMGTLTDAKVTDDGKNTDMLWDTEWEAQIFQNEKFWSVEIKNPLWKYSIQSRIGSMGRKLRKGDPF